MCIYAHMYNELIGLSWNLNGKSATLYATTLSIC